MKGGTQPEHRISAMSVTAHRDPHFFFSRRGRERNGKSELPFRASEREFDLFGMTPPNLRTVCVLSLRLSGSRPFLRMMSSGADIAGCGPAH